MLQRFIQNIGGNFALVLALAAPVFFGAIGLSTDYYLFFKQESRLQQAADAAALASVKELSLAGTTQAKTNQIQEIAKSYALAAYYPDVDNIQDPTQLDVTATTLPDSAEVVVDISYKWAPMFAQFFDQKVTPIKVSATAKLAGDSLTCVIGLMQPQIRSKASIHIDNNAILKADGCSVYSNSISRYGLRADNKASMNAQSICSAGGVITFGKARFNPKPITDCPKIEDPLADRVAPAYGNCDYDGLVINTDTVLSPGVYCNGLTINSDATVIMNHGIYVIKDGPFIVTDQAAIKGEFVSFFLTGDKSIFEFHKGTTIDLTASQTGSLAGILFFEDRNVPYSFNFNPFDLNNLPPNVRLHRISSNNARNLLGTIYLSRSLFLIDSDAPVADASAYTAIITGRLWLQKGPILTLNAKYTDTTVPVPDGLIGTEPILIK